MRKVEKLHGFPVEKDNEKGIVIIKSDCDHPLQSNACKSLYQDIEKLILKDEKIKFPVNVHEWQVIIEPTEQNKMYYSFEGILKYINQYKKRIIGTTTLFKPEIYFNEKYNLPIITLHFYLLSYNGELFVENSTHLSNIFLISVKDILITPERRKKLEENNINVEWIKHIPFLPMELIKFDDNGNVQEFTHQKLNLLN